MTKKASKLINERVIRRWGKLANMPSLTENFIDNLEEEDAMEDEMAAAEDEIAAGEEEVEAGEEAEASVEEQEAVENIVQAVVDAISAETGVEIEVEGGAGDEAAMDDMDMGMDASDAMDGAADDEMDDADAAMAMNRKDLDEKKKGSWKKGGDDNPSGKKDDGESKGDLKADDKDYNRKDETLNIDVVDDEALTEVVLKRVVERLLKKK
jgi:hypothetical protein